MKTISPIVFRDADFNYIKRVKKKSGLTWREYILELAKFYNENYLKKQDSVKNGK